jgi:dTMP kinase
VREPGGTEAGEVLRGLLKTDPLFKDRTLATELFLFLASRSDVTAHKIRPALEAGAIVVCDRFIDSTVVYQGMVSGVPLDLVRKLNTMATDGLVPELTFLLQVSSEHAARRRENANREQGCFFEQKPESYHQAVREGYAKLAQEEPERILPVNGEASAEDVSDVIWSSFLAKMDAKPLSGRPA